MSYLHPQRNKLALALDVDDLVEAMRIATELRPWFKVAKVGLELFAAVGPDAIGSLSDLGYDVFVDLKLYDIPTTVEKAARVIGSLGASYLTIHAQGGGDILKAGVAGLNDGAARAGMPTPTSLAITVLTSDNGAPAHILPKRVREAVESGCTGLVGAARDVHEARMLAPRLTIVVPGIRPEGSNPHDQARSATPDEAVRAGADLLVIGRAVTEAADPQAAAEALASSITA